MSILALKQEITRLSKRGRQEIFAYLVRLKHDTPEWKRATARRLREMRKGKAFGQTNSKLAFPGASMREYRPFYSDLVAEFILGLRKRR
jgi:hypothetical protein